jgi:GINS complex subunit 4
MADLYHLLDELDEDDHDDDDGAMNKGRVSTDGTAATELLLSEEWETSPDRRRTVEVPLALQKAKEQQQQQREYHHNEKTQQGYNYGDEEEEDDDEMVAKNELYSRLHEHWSQEGHSPELLEHDEAMVEDIKTQLEERQDVIDQLETSGESIDALLSTMAQLDVDRVKFVLSDYLSSRLSKIEAHPLYLRERLDHMSEGEVAYLKQYGALLEHHLRQTVLDHIPEAWQALDEPNMIDRPDYEAYHFWLVKETIDNEGIEHDAGTCLVAKYKDMRESMKEGKVELQL